VNKTVLTVLLGVVALAAVVALIVNAGGDEAAPSYADVSVSGQALPQLTDGGDPALGTRAPELSGVDFDGTPVEIRHDRQPHAVVFLAHWCPGCQQEVSSMSAWIAEAGGAPAGVTLRSVFTGTDSSRPNYPPAAWAEREGWPVPAIVDDRAHSAAQAFGLHAYPYWVFLDADGIVLGRRAGVIEPAELEAILEQLASR
jgi:cytochrome c biogenesis protein CcmG, thiol:disulfide interchange protein DsbE